jgi:hypothetical protein
MTSTASNTPRVGDAFPPIALPGLDGRSIRLQDYRASACWSLCGPAGDDAVNSCPCGSNSCMTDPS